MAKGGFTEVTDRDNMGWSPLHHACDASSWSWRAQKSAMGLIEMTPPWIINARTTGSWPSGATCLHLAAEGSDKLAERSFVVRKLLEWGAEVDKKNAKGNTALLLASATGVTDIMTALLHHGADPKVLNDRDLSVYQAAMQCSGSSTQMLEERGQKRPRGGNLVPICCP